MTRAAIYTRILLATLSLLAVATSASAECAWVLWWDLTTSNRSGSSWSLKEAYDARNACESALSIDVAYYLDEAIKDGHKFLNRGEAAPKGKSVRVTATTVTMADVAAVRGTSSIVRFEWKCLPDTLDPRGPKGSK